METKEIILSITPENLAEAEFMSANFVDKEIKNRAFMNTLGAEVATTYLNNNNIEVADLRNMHSIKRVLEKSNLADIILPNIHIDVRIVFDSDYIFVPKSHFELKIEPDVYMVLKFNENFENIDFIGYFKPDVIDKEKCNNDFYFIDSSELMSADGFIDFVKEFDGDYTTEISDSEILKGRELAILASDDDITDVEYKEFLYLLKSSAVLRDAILEYDNFETLAGRVASFMQDSSYISENVETVGDVDQEVSASEESDSFGILEDMDPNGDNLIDDDEFNATYLNGTEELQAGTIPDIGVSDEAIELAGLAGEREPQTSAPEQIENMDIGTADFNLENKSEDKDDMNIDLFNSIDSSVSDFSVDSDLSEIESGFSQSADDIEFNQINFGENADYSDFDEDTADQTKKITETDKAENPPELDDLDLNAEDLSDWSDENDAETNGLLEFPTEEVSEIDENALSLENNELLDEDLELSENDLLSFEDESESADDININVADADAEENDYERENKNAFSDLTAKDVSDVQVFETDNTKISSFEHYDPSTDEQSSNTGVASVERNEQFDESFDFSEFNKQEDIVNSDVSENNEAQDESAEELYDFGTFAEITDAPADIDDIADVDRTDEVSTLIGNIETSEVNSEITTDPNEVIITDEFLNNSVVIENSVIISDKDFEPGEILLDINKSALPEFESEDGLGELYSENNEPSSGLNNGVRIGARNFNIRAISPKYGIIGLFLIIITAGIILFSFSKGMKNEPEPVTGTLNPETKIKDKSSDTPITIDADNVVMKDKDGSISTADLPKQKRKNVQPEDVAESQYHATQSIPPTSFLTLKKLSWEVPDYISYSAEFRQFFQSSGKALRTALSSDILLAKDYTYTNQIKLSVTFDKGGKFKDAKIISSSGSENVDKIVLQSVNQTLKLLNAPNSLENDESTTVILKIYL